MAKRTNETQAFLSALGATIKTLRKALGLHQDQLGALAGIPGSRVGEIERGVVSSATPRIMAIAKALGTTPAALMRRVEAVGRGDAANATIRASIVAAVRLLPVEDLDLVAALVERLTR